MNRNTMLIAGAGVAGIGAYYLFFHNKSQTTKGIWVKIKNSKTQAVKTKHFASWTAYHAFMKANPDWQYV